MKSKIVSRWNSKRILFECDLPDDTPSGLVMRHTLEKAVSVGANLDGANLARASLDGASLARASLDGANLDNIKHDFFAVLLRATNEVAGLRLALADGRVDGTVYEGDCSCLVGTIAKVRACAYTGLGNGLAPQASRPAERWFLGIGKGDTPETNQISRITVEWLDEFVALLSAAKAAS